jgi:hypothetical protein
MKINEILDVLKDFNTGLDVTIKYAPMLETDKNLLSLCLENFQSITTDTKESDVISILKDVQNGLEIRMSMPVGMENSLKDLVNGILQNLNVVFEDMI